MPSLRFASPRSPGATAWAASDIAALDKKARAMRSPIEKAAASLAKEACTLEKANPGFVSADAVKADCSNAAQLAATTG
jgi:hypothetical protein